MCIFRLLELLFVTVFTQDIWLCFRFSFTVSFLLFTIVGIGNFFLFTWKEKIIDPPQKKSYEISFNYWINTIPEKCDSSSNNKKHIIFLFVRLFCSSRFFGARERFFEVSFKSLFTLGILNNKQQTYEGRFEIKFDWI